MSRRAGQVLATVVVVTVALASGAQSFDSY